MRTYEVNANGNRTYASGSAKLVASVAAAWKRQGHDPMAYVVITTDNRFETVKPVQVSTVAETAKRMVQA